MHRRGAQVAIINQIDEFTNGTTGEYTDYISNTTIDYTVTGNGTRLEFNGLVGGLVDSDIPSEIIITFATPAQGVTLVITGINNSRELVSVTVDGADVNLSTLHSEGKIIFDGGSSGRLDPLGDFTATSVNNIAYITFTYPVSSVGFTQEPGGSGFSLVDLHSNDTICFTSGTLIKTQAGERRIDELAKGDMVLTMDHGYRPIRWIGSSTRLAEGALAPILIRKGALGNDRDLRVSPQHRMLLQGWQAELLFGETEVLATAKSLINDHSIVRVEGGEVEYFHMLFDAHEIVWAEGSPSESFHPGKQGWKGLDNNARDEILRLFPQLTDGSFGPSARMSLKHKEGQLLGGQIITTPRVTC